MYMYYHNSASILHVLFTVEALNVTGLEFQGSTIFQESLPLDVFVFGQLARHMMIQIVTWIMVI